MARHKQKRREKNEARTARIAHIVDETGGGVREMGGQAGRAGRQANEAAQQEARQFAVIGERAFEAWIKTSNETLRRVLEMNVELATWSHEQVGDSISAARSLAQCRTVGDACGVQLGLMRSSMEKSMRHAGNVLNLAAHAMVDGARVAQENGAARLTHARFAQAD